MYRIKSSTGFTLIELLVVIAIIGVLAALVTASINDSRAKSRDAYRVSQMKEIAKALELYYLDNDVYPGSSDGAWYTGLASGCYISNGSISTFLEPTYMRSTPTWGASAPGSDSQDCLYYARTNNGQGFWLTFRPETAALLRSDEDCYIPGEWWCVGQNY